MPDHTTEATEAPQKHRAQLDENSSVSLWDSVILWCQKAFLQNLSSQWNRAFQDTRMRFRHSIPKNRVFLSPLLVTFIAIGFLGMSRRTEAKEGKYISHPKVTVHGDVTTTINEPFIIKIRQVVTPIHFVLTDGTRIVLEGLSLEKVPPQVYEQGLQLSRQLVEGKRVHFWGTHALPDGTVAGWVTCSSGKDFHPLIVLDSFPRGFFKPTETVDLNAELIARGLVHVESSTQENGQRLLRVEQEAQREKRGIWKFQ